MTDFMDAWNVKEKDFPKDGSPAEKLAFCVRYAILAPSTYNTQPWYFKISNDTVGVYADRRHALPVIDSDDRELTLFCAAALYNLRLAIQYFGFTAITEILPDPKDQDLLARVKLGEAREPSTTEKELFSVITKRHFNRGAFSNKDVPEEALTLLKNAAAEEGAWLHICDDIERGIVLQMVIEGDHMQTSKKNFRRELAAWVNPRRSMSGDGLPQYGQSFANIMGQMTPSIIRRFEVDGAAPANDTQLSEGTPVLAILGSNSGGTVETMYAGQSFMRLLLRAQHLGLSMSPLNQPCEVPELRLRLHDEMMHPGRAQMILRIGYGGKAVPTPRRPIESFIEFEGKAPESFASAKVASKKGFFSKLLAKRA
ncbi:MAG: nitroreductase [Pseudomonadota bacterium]